MSVGEKARNVAAGRQWSMARGAATLLASSLFRQGLGLATLVITTRLLTPADFGIAAYVVIASMLLELLQREITSPLVRLPTVTCDHLDTMFTFQLILGSVSAVLVYVLAEPIATLFSIPLLADVTPVVAVMALALAFRSPGFRVFERELRFNPAATEIVVGQIAYSAVAITLAWVWRDFWALLVAVLVQLATRGVYTFHAAPMRPRLSLARWRDTLGFSGWAMGSSLAQFLVRRLPQLIIGGALGLTEAGLFRLGTRIVDLVTNQVASPLSRVIFPGLADVSRQTGGHGDAFARLNAMVLAVILPLGVGAALIAEDVLRVGFGPEWLAAAPVVTLLAPLRALETLQANARAASLVDGNPRLLFMRNSALLALVAVLMWIGVRYGFVGALAATAASSLAAVCATLFIARRYGSGRFLEPILVAWRSFAACAAMAVAVHLVGRGFGLGQPVGGLPVALLLETCVGLVVYPAVHLALWVLRGRPAGVETVVLELLGRLQGRARSTP